GPVRSRRVDAHSRDCGYSTRAGGGSLVIRDIILALALLAAATPARASLAHPDPRAERLVQEAQRYLGRNSIDLRRMALRDLEQATLIDRDNPSYELLLARTYLQCGFLKSAQHRFERVTALAPEDAAGRYGLGQVWRRDWL